MDMEYVFEDEYVEEQIAEFNVPAYDKEGVVVVYKEAIGRLDSYLNVEYRATPLNVPILRIDGRTWMSLTPMELQSQEVAAQLMHGKVGILGLGLGYIVWRAMINEEVDEILVFEQNPRVIKYFLDTFKDREGFSKVRIQEGDARETCKGYEFDVLYNDIYPTMLPNDVIDDIKLFCGNNEIGTYRFWGQERVILDAYIDDTDWSATEVMTYTDRMFLGAWMQNEDRSGLYRQICDEEFYSDVLNTLEAYA